MKISKLFLFFVVCMAANAQDVKSGTIIVVSKSKAKVIIAADSRVTTAQGLPIDDYCKITRLNSKLAFAAAGSIEDHSGFLPQDLWFKASEVAREVDQTFKPDIGLPNQSTVWQKAKNWGLVLSDRLRRGILLNSNHANDLLSHQKPTLGAIFIQGIFAGVEKNGNLSVAVATVQYDPPRKGWTTPIAQPLIEAGDPPDKFTWIDPYGVTQIAWNYIHRSDSDFSKEIKTAQLGPIDQFDENIPIKLVQRTITEDTTPELQKVVGGKIDAVRLLAGKGVEWITPQRCPTVPIPKH